MIYQISQEHLVLIINIIQRSHALSHICKSYQIVKEAETIMTRLDFYLQKNNLKWRNMVNQQLSV